MNELRITGTGGHDESGHVVSPGTVIVYGYLDDAGEIGIVVTRRRGAVIERGNAYLSVEQAKRLRKHLKRLIAKAGE